MVQASTGGALIGDATPPVDERSLPKPLSPYGASKLAGEGYAHAFAKTYGMRTVAVRFGNVYGPWCARKRGVLNAFFGALHDGAAAGDLRRRHGVPRLRARVATSPPRCSSPWRAPAFPAAPCCTPPRASRRRPPRSPTCAAWRPGGPATRSSTGPARPGEVGRNFASYDLARRLLGYSPTVRIEDGIPLLWQWFKAEVFRD